jgi:hypothetical protein
MTMISELQLGIRVMQLWVCLAGLRWAKLILGVTLSALTKFYTMVL